MTTNVPVQDLPAHIAIIMDGNGRWAQKRGRPRFLGHREGAKTVRKITTTCAQMGIKQLTLYAFSYENWQRPIEEVNYLMKLLRKFLVEERSTIMKNNIRFMAVGRLDRLPSFVAEELEKTRDVSSGNTGMTLCLAISYGGRAEIIDATKIIAEKVALGSLSPQDITEDIFAENLYQANMPDPDLLIRTGGEMRVSNFLLWQISYSEFWSTPALWPDFGKEELRQAIDSFNLRERRFGKVPTAAKA